MSNKIIQMADVEKHKSGKSAWIVIHNDVYDVSKFLSEHPGGEEALLKYAGNDGTQPFEDVGHSEDARLLLASLKIGSLPPQERTIHTTNCCGRIKGKNGSLSARSSRRSMAHVEPELQAFPAAGRRVTEIVVPKDNSNKKWKYILLALAVAAAAGFAYKKFKG